MLGKPHFFIEPIKNTGYISVYTTMPIARAVEVTSAQVRFDPTGTVDAMIVPESLYAVTCHVLSDDPLELPQLFPLLLMSGLPWQAVQYESGEYERAVLVDTLLTEHIAVQRTHWLGGRRVLYQQYGRILGRYIWNPQQWKLLQRSLQFERLWWQLQRDPAVQAVVAVSLRYHHDV